MIEEDREREWWWPEASTEPIFISAEFLFDLRAKRRRRRRRTRFFYTRGYVAGYRILHLILSITGMFLSITEFFFAFSRKILSHSFRSYLALIILFWGFSGGFFFTSADRKFGNWRKKLLILSEKFDRNFPRLRSLSIFIRSSYISWRFKLLVVSFLRKVCVVECWLSSFLINLLFFFFSS